MLSLASLTLIACCLDSPLPDLPAMTRETTLSRRGVVLATKSGRDKSTKIRKNPYDPEKNPDGFVNMGVAENYAMVADVAAFANSRNLGLTARDFTYGVGPWGTERLRKAMAGHMTHYFSSVHPIDPEDILVANGVTPLCEMLGFTICDPGDAILYSRPMYQSFATDFGLKAQIQSLFVNLDAADPFGPGCVTAYEEALKQAEKDGVRVRALMLCNPHNPLGICYPKDTIIALMKLCQQYRLHLLSDEIYATSVYQVPDKHARPFVSVLSFDTTPYIDPTLLHVIYGMSKDFAGGGIRLGVIYTHNAHLRRALETITQFHWAGLPSQALAATIMEDRAWIDGFIKKSQRTLAERNTLCRRLLDEKGVKYWKGSNAGFFLWIDLSPWLKAFAPSAADTLTDEDGWAAEEAMTQAFLDNKLYLTDGRSLHSEEPGHFRLIFSQPEVNIHAGLGRLFKVLGI